LVISFCKWGNFSQVPQWIGLDNYGSLKDDPLFWNAIKRTVEFVVIVIPLQTLVSVFLALALNQRLAWMKVYRPLFIIPWITTPVVVGFMWKWLYQNDVGLINSVLSNLHLPTENWLTDEAWTMIAIVLVTVWQFAGYNMMFILAGLQGISEQLYEAASLDGAGRIRQHIHITLPMLKPVLYFTIITSVIGSFQIFDIVYNLFNGAPPDSVRVYYFYLYQKAFVYSGTMGSACAMAVVLFLILVTVTLVQTRVYGEQDVG
jgi:multiple sugar transport system permease protein/sn-glycerol 3-phosphate transport system permease protein